MDIVSNIEKEGKILHEIRQYLLSIGKLDEKLMEEFNNLFERMHNERN